MVVFVIFILSLFFASQQQLYVAHEETSKIAIAESTRSQTIALAQLVNQYIDDHNGTPPASLAALAATPGYQAAKQYADAGSPYLAVYAMNDGTNNYSRVIVYTPPIDGSISATNYLLAANNACGTTDASAAGNWCGHPKGNYWIINTNARISGETSKERLQQQETLRKFASYFNANGNFPDAGGGNGSAGTFANLITGYNQTATTCAGTWQWNGIPLACNDIYTIWGTPRTYNYLDNKHIAIYSEAPWLQSGLPIAIASEINNN